MCLKRCCLDVAGHILGDVLKVSSGVVSKASGAIICEHLSEKFSVAQKQRDYCAMLLRVAQLSVRIVRVRE